MIPRSTSASSWSVRTFLIALVLACLLPGFFGAAALFISTYRESRAQLERSSIISARALVQAVDNHLLRVQAVAQALATSDSVIRGDFITFHQQAREVVASVGLGNNVVLRDEEGRQLLNTVVDYGKPLIAPPAPEQVRAVFASGKPIIANLFYGPVLKRPIMSIDVPVVMNGKVVYALGVGILPANFNAILQAQNLPAGWIAGVFDRTGTIVGRTHSPEKYVGHKAGSKLLKPMMETREGAGEATTVDGFEVVSFYSRSPVTGWSVAIGIPQQAVKGMLTNAIVMLAIGVAVLFGIALLLAWAMGGKIAHSIRALKAPAIALGRGESGTVPQVHVKEAAEVASAIGRASHLLQERSAALRAREAELFQFKFFSDHANDSHLLLDPSGHIRYANKVASERFGYSEQELLQMRIMDLDPDFGMDNFRDLFMRAKQGRVPPFERPQRRKAGTVFPVEVAVTVLEIKGEWLMFATSRDISERKLHEQRVRDASLHDWLTGLPNRALVFEYGGHLLAAARRGHGRGALLFIDLDRFKPINDLYGHETGDRVLQEVGRRLRQCTRTEDLVGRIGGDEFVILLPHLDASRHRAAIVAQHVVDSISRPFQVDARELSISPSIGISYFPEHAEDVDALIHAADLAMYQAKQSGRANFQFYTPELERRADESVSIEARLRHALRHDGLKLHYQPVIDIRSGRLIGAEALVRLVDHGEDGEMPGPAIFIPVAESTGLIAELGAWVAMAACCQYRAWLAQGLKIRIAINVSPLQFRQRTFAEKLRGIIADTRMDPDDLEIELTESAVMESVDDAVAILNRIKSLGVKVALDDFGTGYSSLSSLSNLPLDKLKVDQSFVRRIGRDKASRAVTEAIITLGRSLNLDVVGEGIESEETLRYLDEHGCNLAQGYWFSAPLSAQEFAAWSRERWSRNRVIPLGQA